jgi:uncharacterized membrane protein YphA (DoxX/SURF4 family)
MVVGTVFLSEGIQKFLFEELRGAGRFEKIGLPSPELLGPLVGGTEIICGILILLGFYTRLAVIPTIIIMLAAFFTTKSQDFGRCSIAVAPIGLCFYAVSSYW